jgi:diacylglycerol kinase (ATP)
MTNPHKGRTGLDRLIRATGYSIEGLTAAYRGESAFRQEFWLAAVLLPLALWVGRGWVETALLMASVLLVLIVELLNSGIEAAIDRVSFEMHDLSKRAKDLASAAVLLSLILCGGVWLAALWQRFFA